MTTAPPRRRGRVRTPALLAVLAAVALLAGACAGSGAADDAGAGTPDAAQTPGVKPQFTVPPDRAPPDELVAETLISGSGPQAAEGDTVEVHYVGRAWSTGREFDASWDRGQPFMFELGTGRVIPGWEQGVAGMRVGERRRLVIPPRLAYGEQGAGAIGPGETLVFVVDLIGVS